MCGLAGWAGIPDSAKEDLTLALGICIDYRGGDAIGYATSDGKNIKHGRKLGLWIKASQRMIKAAADGTVCTLHTRYTTCGDKKNVDHAHPFPIRRGRKAVLYGSHNGMLWNAEESAKRNHRRFTVDSKEFFELLADNDVEAINDLIGYGVVQWLTPKSELVHFSLLSENADLELCDLKEGGFVWASTKRAILDSVEAAKLTIDGWYSLPEAGQVFTVSPTTVQLTPVSRIKVADFSSASKGWNWNQQTGTYSEDGGSGWSYSDLSDAIEESEQMMLDEEKSRQSVWNKSQQWKCAVIDCWEDVYNEGLCFAHDSLGIDYLTNDQKDVVAR